jgi:hypothetical protein
MQGLSRQRNLQSELLIKLGHADHSQTQNQFLLTLNPKIMIDLSKAYAGQVATLRNNVKLEIKAIYRQEYGVNVNYHIHSSCGNYDLACFVDGKDCDNETEWDIIELSEPKRIQVARLEGEIGAYENILLFNPGSVTFDFILQKRADAKAQLSTLNLNSYV